MNQSYYSKSKALLEKEGYIVGKTEMPWNQFSKVRKDLFGIMDGVAIDGKGPIVGLQVTDGNKVHEHLIKALESNALPLWLQSGGRFVIHAWRILLQDNKDGKRGKRGKYECRVIELIWTGKEMVVKE